MDIQSNQKNNEFQLAAIVALVFHILLFVGFAFINVGWQYAPAEWVEMEFVNVRNRPAKTQVRPRTVPQASSVQPQQIVNQPAIKLPKRQMLEDEEPEIKREINKISDFNVGSRGDAEIKNVERREFDLQNDPNQTNEKNTADSENLTQDDRQVKFQQEDLGRGVSVPFQIEGEAAERSVIHKVIPEYPSGIRNEATVRFRFTVLPSGVIVNIVPTQKADATLENVALAAFQQWRFNALSRDVEQRNQTGLITFRFVIR